MGVTKTEPVVRRVKRMNVLLFKQLATELKKSKQFFSLLGANRVKVQGAVWGDKN